LPSSHLIWLLSHFPKPITTAFMRLPWLVGFFVGRAVMGWAVYANVFFFLILARVNDGKPAGELIFSMLLLLATLPFFYAGVLRALDWGAPVWLVALFLAAAACATTPGHEK
jgi:hypothetical protein